MRRRVLLILGFVGLTILVILAGRLLGYLTAPAGPAPAEEVQRILQSLDEPDAPVAPGTARRARAGAYVAFGPATHLPTVIEELELALQSGVRRIFLETDLSWDRGDDRPYAALGQAMEVLGDAEVRLVLRLNPDTDWLDRHPDEVSAHPATGDRFPSIVSEAWGRAGEEAMVGLADFLATSGYSVSGVVLSALEDGLWYRSGGDDGTQTMVAAYRGWLRERYDSEEALSTAWNRDEALTFDRVSIPAEVATSANLEALPAHTDFASFLEESTAAAIQDFSASARGAFGEGVEVWARFGSMLDMPAAIHGQWMLADADVRQALDGVLFPLSGMNRGAGEAIGPPSAVHAVSLRGMPWYIIDDTRTGIRWDLSEGTLNRPVGFDAQVLLPIYERNAGLAALWGGGVLWADLDGTGNLVDPTLLETFGKRLPAIFELQRNYSGARPVHLSVVVDPLSPRHIGTANAAYRSALESCRNAAQQAGIPANYVFLDDLLSGLSPQTSIAVFPNFWYLDRDRRDALHAYLREHGMAAIWLYAPGAIGAENAPVGISETVLMNVEAFDGPAPGEPTSVIAGNWIQDGEVLSEAPDPAFYVDDTESDVLARYGDSDAASVSIRFMDSGWASVYIATPELKPDLLMEILEILDHAPMIRPAGDNGSLVVVHDENVLVHTRHDGEYSFEFDRPYDISDLLDETALWPNKRLLSVQMKAGGTRILHLEPADTSDVPIATPSESAPGTSAENQPEPTASAPG